jgi:hypothetical protein
MQNIPSVQVDIEFDSLRERTLVDTPTLHDLLTRRRSSRIFYVGVIYNFGGKTKKSKDDALQYDTSSP